MCDPDPWLREARNGGDANVADMEESFKAAVAMNLADPATRELTAGGLEYIRIMEGTVGWAAADLREEIERMTHPYRRQLLGRLDEMERRLGNRRDSALTRFFRS